MGKNYTVKEKEKKRKKQRNEITISKDKKKVILLLFKLKDKKIVFIGDLGHFQSLIKFKNKNMGIIKCRKVKYGAYQGGHSALLAFFLVFHVSLLIPRNLLHVILQPLLVPRSGIDVSRRSNATSHLMAWPSLMKPNQDPICKHLYMEGTFNTKSSLTLSKLP